MGRAIGLVLGFGPVSATLVAKGLAAGYGERVLFSGLDLVVAPGDVIGLVGVNGAGKSTLLRMLAGIVAPEEGTVRLSPPAANVGYLPQEPDRRAGETVRAFLGRRTGVTAAQAELDRATAALTESAAGADEALRGRAGALARARRRGPGRATPRWPPTSGSGSVSTRAMTSLSGGQAARAGMASLLLSRYDVFLLDEPTNDLDLDGLDRLETFVTGLRAATVLVSHDREFLARTVTGVVELDLAQQQVRTYGGGYDSYLAEREVAAGTRASATRSTPAPGPRSSSGPARSGTGWRRACATPAARPPTTTRSAATCAPRPPRSRPPRPGRPSG